MDSRELQAWWDSAIQAGRIHAQQTRDRMADLTPATGYVAAAVTDADLDDCEPIDLSDDLDAPYEFDTYAELRDEARNDDA